MQRIILAAFFLAYLRPATAAQISGVVMPDVQDLAGTHFVLNGAALRTYSFMRIHIYVAGLYLPQRSNNPSQILASNQPKLLRFAFLRDVGAAAARRSWRESLDNNCLYPCHLAPAAVDQFLAQIPPVHSGDTSSFLFADNRLEISLNGQLLGRITDPSFVKVVLASFIGEHPTAPDVKRGLLGTL